MKEELLETKPETKFVEEDQLEDDNIINDQDTKIAQNFVILEYNDLSLKLVSGQMYCLISQDEEGRNALFSLKKQLDHSEKTVQFVPDDIICYTNMRVKNFLKGMTFGQNEEWNAAENLLRQFEINPEEKLMEMTFEQNRLVAMIASFIKKPDFLLMDCPYDMLSTEVYESVFSLVQSLCESGTTVVLFSNSYEEVLWECAYYAFLEEKRRSYLFECKKLPHISQKVDVFESHGSEQLLDEMEFLGEKKGRFSFVYHGLDKKKLAKWLLDCECERFLVNNLSMRDQIYEYLDLEEEAGSSLGGE